MSRHADDQLIAYMRLVATGKVHPVTAAAELASYLARSGQESPEAWFTRRGLIRSVNQVSPADLVEQCLMSMPSMRGTNMEKAASLVVGEALNRCGGRVDPVAVREEAIRVLRILSTVSY